MLIVSGGRPRSVSLRNVTPIAGWLVSGRMGWLVVAVRRMLWLVLIGAVGGAAYSWWRDRDSGSLPGPAEWPPLVPQRDTPRSSTDDGDPALGNASILPDAAPTAPKHATATPSSPSTSAPGSSAPGSATTTSSSAGSSSAVNSPEARSYSSGGTWVAPDDGSCPLTHPIKTNDNSGIFHVPDGRFYKRTRAARCYTTAAAALADGYRRAKN